jgi:hypothetical protein
MKKGLLFLPTLFIFISLSAQESNLEPTTPEPIKRGLSNFSGGFKAGFTASLMTKDGYFFEGYNKLGAYAGGFVNFPVSKDGRWLIQPEMSFIMKGCNHLQKYDEDGWPIGNSYRVQLMYAQMPVLVKWKIITGFELEFGPTFGILFKDRDVEWFNKLRESGHQPFQRFEFSAMIGIGYLFNNHYGVSLRYESSLMPVRKFGDDFFFFFRGQYNQSFVFSAYYQF